MPRERGYTEVCEFGRVLHLHEIVIVGFEADVRTFFNNFHEQYAAADLIVSRSGATTVAEIKVPPQSRPRLMEMGLLVGTPVELVRFAPLGDPVEIKVRGYNLTLRKQEAEQIWVKIGE